MAKTKQVDENKPHAEAPIFPSNVVKMADSEQKKSQEREKQEKFAKLVPLIEKTAKEADDIKYQHKRAVDQVKGLKKEAAKLGFSAVDVEAVLKERKQPALFIDQTEKDYRKRINAIHEILKKNGVSRVGEWNKDSDFYQRAFNVCMQNKAMNITAGILMDEMKCEYSQAVAILPLLEEHGVLSKPDDSGARAVVWIDDVRTAS